MIQFSFVLFFALIALAIGQAIYVLIFVRALNRPTDDLLDDATCPNAAVILCLRGDDPYLDKCLNASMHMNYPRYTVVVVVDHPDDPCWRTLQRTVGENPIVQIQTLRSPDPKCGLKCSCLIQAIESLDSSCEFVALLDADTIPHRDWLRSLATGLQDKSVGAVTGIRWYIPNENQWGTLVRYLWNSAAVVQMYLYGIAWGGTLAIKCKVIYEANLLQRWGKSFCEDTMIHSVISKSSYKLVTRNDLVMPNRESCGLTDFFNWLTRQLLTARLYHPKWSLVVFHAFSTTIANLAALILLAWFVFLDDQVTAQWALAGFLIFQIVNYTLLSTIEHAIAKTIHKQKEKTSWLSLSTIIRLILAVPVTQVVYFAAVLNAIFLKSVSWRGIQYEIDGPNNIQMTGHQVFQPHSTSDRTNSL